MSAHRSLAFLAALGGALLAAGAATADELPRLPGWDEASSSAGCLAMAARMEQAAPERAHRTGDIRAEGDFWAQRLYTLAPEERDRIEYWEAANEWLREELGPLDADAASDFLAEYRGRCIIEQATLYSEAMWGTER